MKTSEFIAEVEGLGFKVMGDDHIFVVDKFDHTWAIVSTNEQYRFSTLVLQAEWGAEGVEQLLFELLISYAKTDLAMRQDLELEMFEVELLKVLKDNEYVSIMKKGKDSFVLKKGIGNVSYPFKFINKFNQLWLDKSYLIDDILEMEK